MNGPKEVSNTKVSSYLQYNVVNIEKDVMNFGVSETRPVDSDFYINSNFFSDNATIGLVVINGKQKSSRVKGGGFFYVLNDLPHVSPLKCPSRTKFASQTILWGINNGDINHRLTKSKHAKQKRYRTLMGQNKDGDIIVISSNRIGFVTIKEIIEFSLTLNIVDGILLDGGTSVDYKFSDDNGITTFSSVPHSLKNFLEIKHPTTYIYGNFK
ncbi:MAG: phosphodiester glycosidase family protein [Flavobacteriaceae bacterium]|nr:phosphodiester glycosidase family protein [Flavobacteriaceae bacterium]